VNDGVKQSEVGLAIGGSVAQKSQEVRAYLIWLPLQIDAEHLKGYLKG